MKTKEIVLSLTDDEFNILGNALEVSIAKQINNYPQIIDLIEEDINLLNDFIMLGYRLTDSDPKTPFDVTVFTDAYTWAEHIKTKTVDKPVKKKKKK
jgi:hypothetical protein